MTQGNGAGDQDALRDEIRRTRTELGETVEALAAKADVKARIKESAAQTRERVRERAGHTVAAVQASARDVRATAHDAGEVARRNPLPWATIATGALAVAIVILIVRGRGR